MSFFAGDEQDKATIQAELKENAVAMRQRHASHASKSSISSPCTQASCYSSLIAKLLGAKFHFACTSYVLSNNISLRPGLFVVNR